MTKEFFWNRRALNYDDQVGPMYEEAYRLTAELSCRHLKAGDRVLEFACGTGIVTLALAPHVAHIRAIDIAEEMTLRAREKIVRHGITNVEVTQTDLFDPCLEPGSFDAVLGFNVLLYVDNFEQVMARILELLKPGGIFLSATDCLGGSLSKAAVLKFWRSRTGKMPYVGFFTQKSLPRKIEKNGFEILETENFFPSPPNLFVTARKAGGVLE
jgi:ubiquinone/menaquinone biosynthesis C-methylase UbiE